MVAYKKEFQGVPSALTFLTSDGITGAHILNGKIVAPRSKYDGIDATEKNLLTAADYTGYDLPKTDLSNYMNRSPVARQAPVAMPIARQNQGTMPIGRQMGPTRGAGINNNMLVKLATMSKLFPGLVS
mgnify:CR=1 FL=1